MANLFLMSEPLTGRRHVEVTGRKTKTNWAKFVKRIADKWYPGAPKITLAMDNLGTHKPGALYEVYEPSEAKRIWDRLEFRYTPMHGSWLNMAEIELNMLTGQCLNRRIGSMEEMKVQVESWEKHRKNKESKINWHFTTDDARIELMRLYPSIHV